MANANSPAGLRPVRYLSGAPYNGAANKYYVGASDTNAVYLGSLVKLTGTADADGIAEVTGIVSTGDDYVGVVVGVAPTTADSAVYREASTERYVMVADDPALVFEVQEDSVGSAGVPNTVGSVADLTSLRSGSTVTGRSTTQIDTSTATTSGDGTEDVLLVGLVQREDNEFGNYAKWLVRLNNHALVTGSTGT